VWSEPSGRTTDHGAGAVAVAVADDDAVLGGAAVVVAVVVVAEAVVVAAADVSAVSFVSAVVAAAAGAVDVSVEAGGACVSLDEVAESPLPFEASVRTLSVRAT